MSEVVRDNSWVVPRRTSKDASPASSGTDTNPMASQSSTPQSSRAYRSMTLALWNSGYGPRTHTAPAA